MPLLVAVVTHPVFNAMVIGAYVHGYRSVRQLSSNRVGGHIDAVGPTWGEASGCKKYLCSLDL